MPNTLLNPISPAVITQRFGDRPEVYQQFGLKGHNGIDYRTTFDNSPDGKRAVVAPYWGTVVEVGDQGSAGYGRFVRVNCQDGAQYILGHLDHASVKVGDVVAAGQALGVSDNTGFSTAAHLHFGYRPPGWDKLVGNGYQGYIDQSHLIVDDPSKLIPPGTDQAFAARMQGRILVDTEDHGRKWYVFGGFRYEIDKAPAFEASLKGKPFVTWCKHADVAKIQEGPQTT